MHGSNGNYHPSIVIDLWLLFHLLIEVLLSETIGLLLVIRLWKLIHLRAVMVQVAVEASWFVARRWLTRRYVQNQAWILGRRGNCSRLVSKLLSRLNYTLVRTRTPGIKTCLVRDIKSWIYIIWAITLETGTWVEHLIANIIQTSPTSAILMIRQIIGNHARTLITSSSLMPFKSF